MKTNSNFHRAARAFLFALVTAAGTLAISVSATAQDATSPVNSAPTVHILNPTNGSVFILPGSFTLEAAAQDNDGTVAKVEYFNGANKLGETTQGNPHIFTLTNLALGTYVYTAKATDDGGRSTVSAPVTVNVSAQLPVTIVDDLHLNSQTGNYEQNIRVSNPSRSTVERMRVYIFGLDDTTTVENSNGKSKGVSYVQSPNSIPPGGFADLVIEYHLTTTVVPNPVLVAAAVSAGGPRIVSVPGTGVHIGRGVSNCDGTFTLEFASEAKRIYYVSYSSDLKHWKAAPAAVFGNGAQLQWCDNGNPKTECAPSQAAARFYRVCVLPQSVGASFHRSQNGLIHGKGIKPILCVTESGIVCIDPSI